MIECTKFKTFQKGSFQGFADLLVPSWGIEIKGCSLYMKEGRRWVSMPSKEFTNAEGEKKYAPIVKFHDKNHMDAFSEQAKQAIDKWCSENAQQENNQEPAQQEISKPSEFPF